MKPLHFRVLIIIQLCIPALIYIANGLHNGREDLSLILPNYFYMAMPHLLIIFAFLWKKSQASSILLTLIILNLLLASFQVWIRLCVSLQDSSIIWILYYPLWIAVLIISILLMHLKDHYIKNKTKKIQLSD